MPIVATLVCYDPQDNASVTTDLPALTAVWRDFGLCISRAKVRALAGTAGDHTFYLVDRQGKPPAETVVQVGAAWKQSCWSK